MKVARNLPKGGMIMLLLISFIISCGISRHANTIEADAKSISYLPVIAFASVKQDTPIVKKPTLDNQMFRKQWGDLMNKTNRAFTQINEMSNQSNEIKTVTLQILKQNVILFDRAHRNRIEKDSALNVVKMVILKSDKKLDSMRQENWANFRKAEEAQKQAQIERTINTTTYSMYDRIISIGTVLTLIFAGTHLLLYISRNKANKTITV